MRLEKLFIGLLLAVCFVSCSKDDEPGNGDDPGKNPNQPENSSSVTINPDGSTSTKSVFSPIDETTFYIDYVKYKIVDSHLEIIGYDPVELKGDVKPYATVKYLGTTYNTRIIAEEAFRGSSITSINIPNSVTEIGGSAFSGCSFLTSITIPNSVTEIERSAFEGCSSLASITIPNWVTKINGSAFRGCSSLTSITIPNSVTGIGSSAFSGCSSLTSVTIPNSVTEIDEYTFFRCSSLVEIIIPSSVVRIFENSFYGCYMLSNIYVGGKPSLRYDILNPLPDEVYANAVLHVKAENMDWFKSGWWSRFKNIVGDYSGE
ncbi:MAG: leucine-rich repeat domain-containing protein [Duncaniella sp.]|uniref:leucine-rich repeat domain-containing protein n=1 Tax=Duncaniella sp. TaxID=2518496 RepID=UPI0023CB6ACE|nr:leucine-rich repeat domain-containing protein [Duncaniella sp.]MDE5989287.1 leucine-rich repeat domain-containing protein [Duncaniella sp.]